MSSIEALLRAAVDALTAGDDELADSLTSRARIWASRDAVRRCTRCELSSTRTTAVPWEGEPSSVILVGEAPGQREDELGRPFVGRSGVLLDGMARQAGLVRGVSSNLPGMVGYAIANVVACRPPGNAYDLAVRFHAPERCRVHLDAALDLSGAWLVVLVGAKAYDALGPGGSSSSRRGTLWMGADRRVYTTVYHPAYLLRNPAPDLRAVTVAALERVHDAAVGAARLPTAEFDTVPLSERPAEFERLRSHYERHGWASFRSGVLGAQVVVTDPDRAPKVPAEFTGMARFTPGEVARMRGDQRLLRRVHAAKLAGLGEVVA